MEKEKFNGYIVAAGCLIIMFLLLGGWSSFGLFMPKIAEEFGCSVSSISLVVSASTIAAFAGSFFLGKLIDKLSAKKMLYIATAVSFIGALCYSISWSPASIVIFGLIPGFTLAWGTNACCATIISEWFIEKRGSVIGVVFGGAALGATVFTFLTGILLESIGWRMTYRIFGAGIFIIAVLVNMIMIRTPEQLGQKPLGYKAVEANTETGGASTAVGMSFKEAKASPAFWMILIGSFFLGTLFTGFNTYAPTFWQSFGMASATSSQYMTAFSFIGVIACAVAGVVADKLGSKVFITYILGFAIIGLALSLTWSTSHVTWMILLSIILMGLAYPAQTSVAATVATESFGSKAYAQVVSWLSAGLYLGKASVTYIMGALLDKSGSMTSSFIVLAVFTALALIFILAGMISSPWNKRAKKTLS